jgi:hypothetical protein
MTKIKHIYALLSAHPYRNEIMLKVLILKASGAGTAVCRLDSLSFFHLKITENKSKLENAHKILGHI